MGFSHRLRSGDHGAASTGCVFPVHKQPCCAIAGRGEHLKSQYCMRWHANDLALSHLPSAIAGRAFSSLSNRHSWLGGPLYVGTVQRTEATALVARECKCCMIVCAAIQPHKPLSGHSRIRGAARI